MHGHGPLIRAGLSRGTPRFDPKSPMIATLSLSSLMVGTGLSYAATRAPRRADALERWSGRLLLGGLGLLGAGLPLFR